MSTRGDDTRARMVEAALATLKEEGYAGTTTRAVATRGGFNQALVFYHFGGLTPLLLEALDRSSRERLEAYRSASSSATTLPELVASARGLYAEDVASGHVAVVAELVGASMARPELRVEVLARMQPWLDLAEETLGRVLRAHGLEGLPTRDLASVVVSLYFGLNLLEGLAPGEHRAESLFALGEQIAGLLFPR